MGRSFGLFKNYSYIFMLICSALVDVVVVGAYTNYFSQKIGTYILRHLGFQLWRYKVLLYCSYEKLLPTWRTEKSDSTYVTILRLQTTLSVCKMNAFNVGLYFIIVTRHLLFYFLYVEYNNISIGIID